MNLEHQKQIQNMRSSYRKARKQLNASLKVCSLGTNSYLANVKAIAELDAKEREEEIRMGLQPANVGTLTKAEFLYIAHTSVMPANRAEAEALVRNQMLKDVPKLHYSDEDEAIRKQLDEQFNREVQK